MKPEKYKTDLEINNRVKKKHTKSEDTKIFDLVVIKLEEAFFNTNME